MEDVLNGLSGLRKSNQFSDLKIIVGPEKQVFDAHRCIVCINSAFFKVACTAPFKEAAAKEIELPDASPKIIDKVLEFMYSGDYAVTREDEDFEHFTLTLHTKIFAQADILDVNGLKKHAIHKLEKMLETKPKSETKASEVLSQKLAVIPEILKTIAEHSSESEVGLLYRVLQFVWKHLPILLSQKSFVETLACDGELGLFLLKNRFRRVVEAQGKPCAFTRCAQKGGKITVEENAEYHRLEFVATCTHCYRNVE